MQMRTVVILVVAAFGLYKGIQIAGARVDDAMSSGSESSTDETRSQDVTLDLALDYADKKTVSKSQFDDLNAGMINLRGSVTNHGPAARSISVRVRWKDSNVGSPEQSEVVDLGPFDEGETRTFNERFSNTLGKTSSDGRTANYALEFDITLAEVVRR